jgi:hypothetical protein
MFVQRHTMEFIDNDFAKFFPWAGTKSRSDAWAGPVT